MNDKKEITTNEKKKFSFKLPFKKGEKSIKEKLKSVYALKYGTYATATIAIFLAAIIVGNVLISVISNKYPISIDFTASKEYSVDKENIEFLKGIDYKVDLKVYCSEEYYKDSSFMYEYGGIQDTTGGKYFTQSVELLKQYNKYNKNITVKFIDPFSADKETADVVNEWTENGLNPGFGDILVESYKDGEKKLGLVTLADCYETESQQTGYEYLGSSSIYSIIGNKIEHALANGIYRTTNLKTVKVAMITVNSSDDYIENFKQVAKLNAFEIKNITILGKGALDNYDVAIICSPFKDYTEKEIKVISKWLDNNGKKGKTLMYFHSAACPKLPNIEGLLEEWGIAFENGYKYYTESPFYYIDSNTNMYLQATTADINQGFATKGYSFIANNMVPLKALYTEEPNGTRTVESLIVTEDLDTYKKPDNTPDWKPGTGDSYPAILLSTDAEETDASYVLAISSVDFITNEATVTKSDNGNYKYLCTILGQTARDTNDVYTMNLKAVSDTSGSFTTSTTAVQGKVMGIIFIGLIPAAFIFAAIVVYRKRKNM